MSQSTEILGALRAAGAAIYSQYAVGYENVDVAAVNVAAILKGWPVWRAARRLEDVLPFLGDEEPPRAAPSIVNADELGLPRRAAWPVTKEDQQ